MAQSFPYIAAIVAACLYGMIAVLAKFIDRFGLSISDMLSLRFFLSVVFFTAFALATKRHIRPRNFAIMTILGTCGFAGQAALYFESISRIGPGRAALLLYVYPALSLLWECLHARRWPLNIELWRVIIAVTGCALVGLDQASGSADFLGVAYGLGTAFVYSLFLLGIKLYAKPDDVIVSTLAVCFGAGMPFWFLSNPLSLAASINHQTWAFMLTISVLATMMPIGLVNYATTRLGLAKVSVISTFEPVCAAALGMILLHEPITFKMAVGSVFILGSALLVITPIRRGKESQS
jgi:drug/metabolite transporter (DMT)-like permease